MSSGLLPGLKRRVSLDLRSLTLFRIALALLVLADFCWHGVVLNTASPQLAELLSSPVLNAVGWLILALSLTVFGLGYQTRVSAWLLLIAYVALHVGEDWHSVHQAIIALLGFGLFLPLGRFVSFDDAMDRGSVADGEWRPETDSCRSIATAGVLACSLFILVMLAIQAYESTDRLSDWLLVSVVAVLIVCALVRSFDMLRWALILSAATAAFLLGCYRLMQGGLPLDAWLVVVLATLLLPEGGWQALEKVFRTRHAIRIYYDEPCGFCRKICYIFASFLMLGRCQIATAQSNEAAHALLRENDSWVVYDKRGDYAICWAALLLLMRASPVWRVLGWPLTWIGMGVWGKPLYRLIGNSRNFLSKLTAWLLPYSTYRSHIHKYEAWLAGVWCLVLLAHIAASFSAGGLGDFL